MMKQSEIEYLKQVNAVRKRMGLNLDSELYNQHDFLLAVAEANNQSRFRK